MPRGARPGFMNKGLQAYKIAQKEASDLRKKGLIEKSSMLNMNSAFIDKHVNRAKIREKAIRTIQQKFKQSSAV